MFRDPKQFLLLHVEKVVLVVMLILFFLVAYIYQPWSVEVPEKTEIRNQLEEGRLLVDKPFWPPMDVPDYVGKTNSVYRVPWREGSGPTVLPSSKPVFADIRRGTIWRERAPGPPPVLPPAAVFAKADKGQVVVVFQIDDHSQRRKLEGTAVQEYQDGLEYDHIEIWRIDKSSGERVQITPAEWRPKELPIRYGGSGVTFEVPGLTPRSMFNEPVYIYAQRRPPDDPKQMEEEWRRRMEEEMRRRMEEERQRAEELRKRLEEERIRREQGGPAATQPTRTPTRTPTPQPVHRPTRPTRQPVTVTAPTGWYYFIDQKVDPDAQYEYAVILFCKNPVHGSTRYNEEVVAVVRSAPATVLADKRVPSFKLWFFQGGSASEQLETGNFKVRVLVGGRREITMEEINQIVAELSGDTRTKKTPTAVEPEGTWVERNFTVRPGEEIGTVSTEDVSGEKREVDFRTGCWLVSVQNDVRVDEEPHTAMRPGKDGKIEKVEVLQRVVRPGLLRIAYVDRKGVLQTRWREVVPALTKTELPGKQEN